MARDIFLGTAYFMKQITKPFKITPAWCGVKIRVIKRQVNYLFKHLTEVNVNIIEETKMVP
jgi:hypothetical protein